MNLLFDTNVILDVLLNRSPWVASAQGVWQICDDGDAVGHVSASVLTDIFYISRRVAGLSKAHEAISICLDTFVICPVNRQTLEYAYGLSGNDFEDNVQIACAVHTNLDAILTRDPSGFNSSPVQALTSEEWLTQYRPSNPED